MLMIWSSRARNRSADPVVSCFFGRIAPSDVATESCFSIRGNRENEFASFQAPDTKTLQSQVNKAAKKRLSLSGLEILHGRLQSSLRSKTYLKSDYFSGGGSKVLPGLSFPKYSAARSRAIVSGNLTIQFKSEWQRL